MLYKFVEEVKRENIGSLFIEKIINDMVDVMCVGFGVGLVVF